MPSSRVCLSGEGFKTGEMQSGFQVRKIPLLPSGRGGIYGRLSLHSFRASGLSVRNRAGEKAPSNVVRGMAESVAPEEKSRFHLPAS